MLSMSSVVQTPWRSGCPQGVFGITHGLRASGFELRAAAAACEPAGWGACAEIVTAVRAATPTAAVIAHDTSTHRLNIEISLVEALPRIPDSNF
jgi:hypothetical protein